MISPKRKQLINNVLKSFDRVVVGLKGTTLSDEEFKAISERMTLVMQTLYAQRDNKSKETLHRFNEGMKWLKSIRK